MKLGLGSFEGSHGRFPGVERESSLEATYKGVLREVSAARVICPYPPGSGFSMNALIVSKSDPVRWQIHYLDERNKPADTWEVEIWVLDKVVAEGLVLRHRQIIDPRDRGIYTEEDEKTLLDSLTPDDVSWTYTYYVSDHDRKAAQDRIFNRPISASRGAEWFSSIIAAALFFPYEQGGGYIWSVDDIPDCPGVPVKQIMPGTRPSPLFVRGGWRKR